MNRPPVSPALAVRALACRRGERFLFHDLSFTLDPGQTLVLHDPNGSGQSSLIRTIAGLSPPGRGHAFWRGQDVPTIPNKRRQLALVTGAVNNRQSHFLATQRRQAGILVDVHSEHPGNGALVNPVSKIYAKWTTS